SKNEGRAYGAKTTTIQNCRSPGSRGGDHVIAGSCPERKRAAAKYGGSFTTSQERRSAIAAGIAGQGWTSSQGSATGTTSHYAGGTGCPVCRYCRCARQCQPHSALPGRYQAH